MPTESPHRRTMQRIHQPLPPKGLFARKAQASLGTVWKLSTFTVVKRMLCVIEASPTATPATRMHRNRMHSRSDHKATSRPRGPLERHALTLAPALPSTIRTNLPRLYHPRRPRTPHNTSHCMKRATALRPAFDFDFFLHSNGPALLDDLR